jgi:hypothetical protein
MSYIDDWRALSARLKGLERAANLNAAIRMTEDVQHDERAKVLFPICRAIFSDLRAFHGMHADHLPTAARDSLGETFRRSSELSR